MSMKLLKREDGALCPDCREDLVTAGPPDERFAYFYCGLCTHTWAIEKDDAPDVTDKAAKGRTNAKGESTHRGTSSAITKVGGGASDK